MLKLKFHTYLITMQNVNTGLYRTFFLQAEAAGQFWGFVSVLPLFSLSKCEVPNFGPLYSKLGELNIQNSLACFTYNIPGTSSSNFIGFWGIDIWADFEGTRPSCTPVRPRGVTANPSDSKVEGPGIDSRPSRSSFVSFLLPKLAPILRRYPYMRGPAIFLTLYMNWL